jgi:valyl-tRNA synthetase
MPFLTEELWHGMEYHSKWDSIMESPWPECREIEELAAWGVSMEAEAYVDDKHDLIRSARTLRADYRIAPAQPVDFVFRPHRADDGDRLRQDQVSVASLLKAGRFTIDPAFHPSGAMPSAISRLGAVYLSLDGLIDAEAEVARLQGQLEKLDSDLERINTKLANEHFVRKAPSEVVDQQRTRRQELQQKQEKLRQMISTLAG